jgi:MFS family permease
MLGQQGNSFLFIFTFCIIISMYGGGFATVPAYLKDMFGVMQVGAIHGRLLVAWSLAAIIGPSLINYLRAYQIETVGLPPAQAYSFTMSIMAGLLLLGLIANLLIKPVNERYHHKKELTVSE